MISFFRKEAIGEKEISEEKKNKQKRELVYYRRERKLLVEVPSTSSPTFKQKTLKQYEAFFQNLCVTKMQRALQGFRIKFSFRNPSQQKVSSSEKKKKTPKE